LDPPYERLRQALDDPKASPLDRVLLLRHALRFFELHEGRKVAIHSPLFPPELVEQVGLTITGKTDGRVRLEARPWFPAWLPGPQPADETAMRAKRRRFFAHSMVRGDPFLKAIGHDSYRSAGQRAAIRAALCVPPGARLVVDLPTGEGKSTVFKLIDAVGFVGDGVGTPRGITLVIVPTVTLALDHERTSQEENKRPLAYIGGRVEANSIIRAAIADGTQGLCFLAPEAACGPLRHTLRKAAEGGLLRAVVVDEAHLVEGWGTGFRTAFQTFAGLCASWHEVSPPERRFRTVLLSATLSAAAERTLHDLFGPEEELTVVGAARARPELEFWVASRCDEAERERRILEAILMVPRPAILYVTRVDDANAWYDRLRRFGFGRLEKVHGGTSADSRERILKAWSAGQVDLVVATSAFGLGVDYPHVRTIIHACVPETFDRFYQEAGRAGRDGCAAMSLIVPTATDIEVARSLAQKTVITTERGLERFHAMLVDKAVRRYGHPRYGLRLDAAPGNSREDIDMVGERSIDWNARTLALLARAQLIRLRGIPGEAKTDELEEVQHPYQDVELVRDYDRAAWEAVIEPKREQIAEDARHSISLMERFLDSRQCPAFLVQGMYSTTTRSVALSCGGCNLCRRDTSRRLGDSLVAEPAVPWPAEGSRYRGLTDLLGSTPWLIVEYPLTRPRPRTTADFRNAVQRLDGWGLRQFAEVGDPPSWISDLVASCVERRPWFFIADGTWLPAHWPKGLRLTVFGEEAQISVEQIRANKEGGILLLPDGMRDPGNPARRLVDIAPYPTTSFEGFLSKVAQ
jgi:superfamily II DNA/RNA helicase